MIPNRDHLPDSRYGAEGRKLRMEDLEKGGKGEV